MNTIKLSDAERTRCEIWTRVMGYHRPVHTFNPGKQSEHADRMLFKESRVDNLRGGAAAARQAHNLEVAGSNPAPASIFGERADTQGGRLCT